MLLYYIDSDLFVHSKMAKKEKVHYVIQLFC